MSYIDSKTCCETASTAEPACQCRRKWDQLLWINRIMTFLTWRRSRSKPSESFRNRWAFLLANQFICLLSYDSSFVYKNFDSLVQERIDLPCMHAGIRLLCWWCRHREHCPRQSSSVWKIQTSSEVYGRCFPLRPDLPSARQVSCCTLAFAKQGICWMDGVHAASAHHLLVLQTNSSPKSNAKPVGSHICSAMLQGRS